MVSWGAGSVLPQVTDYHADGSKGLEFTFNPQSMNTYRAHRYAWQGRLLTADRDSIDYGSIVSGDTVVTLLGITNHGATDRTITSFLVTDSVNFSVGAPVPVTIPHGQTIQIPVRFNPPFQDTTRATLYVRSTTASELIATSIRLHGIATGRLAVPLPPPLRGISLDQSRPNPARGGASFPFAIARPGAVTLRVYDVTGRLARTLVDATLPAGEHVARWDGTRDEGGAVPPGVYFCELRSNGERLRRRMILLH
jgi:hypothetical protein